MSERELYRFEPDWTLRPGVLLRLELEERGITPEQAAGRAGVGTDVITGIIDGTARIDEVSADGLHAALGPSRQFWLNLQTNYERALARGARDMSDDYEGEENDVAELDAAARAAGYEVTARCSLVFGGEALIELPGEDVPVRWPVSEVMAGAGLALEQVAGTTLTFTVRESVEDGRVLSGFRLAE